MSVVTATEELHTEHCPRPHADPREATLHLLVHHFFCLSLGFAFPRNMILEGQLCPRWCRSAMQTMAAAFAGFNPFDPSLGAAYVIHLHLIQGLAFQG